jgi:hypothetical protein
MIHAARPLNELDILALLALCVILVIPDVWAFVKTTVSPDD